MCSISEDIEELNISKCGESEQLREIKKSDSYVCRKCGEGAVVLLQKKDPYCKSCFLIYCHHKFRATIGKAKKIKPEHNMLLCCSCGAKSSAMVDMVLQALKESTHKKLLFSIGIVFVDESTIVPNDVEELNNVLSHLYKKTKNLNCSFLYTSLDMAFRNPISDEAFYWEFTDEPLCPVPSVPKNKLLHNISGIKSLTSKLDYIKCLRMQLLLDIAQSEHYTHIFMGDSATDLAIKFLSDIAVGRGSQVAHNTAFYDTQYAVPICRPMREFLNKEIVFYNQLTGVPSVTQPTLITKTDSQSSIQRLTETFVNGLQDNFPATVFTIFRTGGKISTDATHSKGAICVICKSFRDNVDPKSCSAIESLSLSAKLSKPSATVSKGEEFERLKNVVCHGCQIIMNEMDNCASLPPLMLEEMATRTSRLAMKKEIQDYLLCDED